MLVMLDELQYLVCDWHNMVEGVFFYREKEYLARKLVNR